MLMLLSAPTSLLSLGFMPLTLAEADAVDDLLLDCWLTLTTCLLHLPVKACS